MINESETDKLIRDLKGENQRLLAMIQQGGGGGQMDKQALEKMKDME